MNQRQSGSDLSVRLRESLEGALALGGRPVYRLSTAQTSVKFQIGGVGQGSVTLLLDRNPPEVAGGDEPAEIVIELSPEQASSFSEGELVIPNCVLRQQLACRGPVRKYLSFDPILRALLRRAHDPDP